MGRRRGPRPSLLPPPQPAADEIDYHEVRIIMRTTCWKKAAYGSLHVANLMVAQAAEHGDHVTA